MTISKKQASALLDSLRKAANGQTPKVARATATPRTRTQNLVTRDPQPHAKTAAPKAPQATPDVYTNTRFTGCDISKSGKTPLAHFLLATPKGRDWPVSVPVPVLAAILTDQALFDAVAKAIGVMSEALPEPATPTATE